MARINSMPDANSATPSDAAHGEWFRAEVNQAIAEADRPDAEWQSQEEVDSLSRQKRAEWLHRVKSREKATA